jgi:hypothetical protein
MLGSVLVFTASESSRCSLPTRGYPSSRASARARTIVCFRSASSPRKKASALLLIVMLPVHSLPGHAEANSNVLPGPAGSTRCGNLLGFKLLRQPAKAGDSSQASIRIRRAYGLFEIDDGKHSRQHMLTAVPSSPFADGCRRLGQTFGAWAARARASAGVQGLRRASSSPTAVNDVSGSPGRALYG